MKMINDFNDTQAARMLSKRPNPSQYVLSIHSVDVTIDDKGNQVMNTCFDICEGCFKYYYSELSRNFRKNMYLKHRQIADNERSLPYFKRLINCIELSNMGYKWNWSENSLVGKKIGAVLRLEEYRDKYTQEVKTKLAIFSFIPVSEVDDTQPAIATKRLKEDDNNYYTNEQGEQMNFNSFNRESINTDDLPF